jgi:peptidyl-tRNA hydrolase, PTH1 family
MKVVVGLGNPGREYCGNRHNTGYMAAEAFCREKELVFERKNRFKAEIAVYSEGGEKNFVVKPLTFMNLSGQAVRGILDYYQVLPGDLLVVYDDFHLELGEIRIREKGSSGGHNGMESVVQELGTGAFNRLRIGIGTEAFREIKKQSQEFVSRFVLSDFLREEKAVIKESVGSAVSIMEYFFTGSLKKAMNLFN